MSIDLSSFDLDDLATKHGFAVLGIASAEADPDPDPDADADIESIIRGLFSDYLGQLDTEFSTQIQQVLLVIFSVSVEK